MIRWVYDFQIRKEVISLPHLQKEFDGFRIVQLSDLHMGSWTSKKALQDVVSQVNIQ